MINLGQLVNFKIQNTSMWEFPEELYYSTPKSIDILHIALSKDTMILE